MPVISRFGVADKGEVRVIMGASPELNDASAR